MSTTETETTCIECNESVDPEGQDDSRWSPIKEGRVCWGCYESASQYSSTIFFVSPVFDCSVRGYINEIEIITEYGDEFDWAVPSLRDKVKREWKSTDGWRGYYNTTVDGWVDVLDGWTTGGYDDPIARRKATFNDWAEQLCTGHITPPCEVVVVTDPTSNVFSTAVTVFVEACNVETFREWLTDDYEALYDALS